MSGESADGRATVRRERVERIRQTRPDLTLDTIEGSFARYAQAHEEAAHGAPALTRDLQYGPDPRHLLDVHSAHDPGADAAAAEPVPVLVFVHGGGFVSGDRHLPGTPYYDNVAAWAVRHGMVGVLMTYRLAPQHQWPAGAEDVGRAAAWIAGHIGSYGGDPARVVIAGHSAGATHVASYLAGHAGPPAGVTAGALLSGIYDVTIERSDAQVAYFGADSRLHASRSPLRGLVASAIPVMFAVAEVDPPFFHQQAAAALQAFLHRDGTLPPFAWVAGHNHISEVAASGIDDEPLGIPLLRFIETVTGTALPRPSERALEQPAPAT
jgi:triacylglycerol lipase